MGTRNPERGSLQNLGWLADQGYELEARCPGCGREARIATIPLAKRWGYYARIADIAGKLRCRICRAKAITLKPVKWSVGVPEKRRPER